MLAIFPDDAVQLPVDELAMLVLRDLGTLNEVNEYNYGNSLRQDTARGYAGNRDARGAVSEAMAWLHARGLIARKLEDPTSNIVFVTRWGRQALEMSLPAVAAIERVQANLHPLLGQRVRRQFLLGEYEQAIFVAMKAVEVRVRKLAGYGEEIIGTDLMIKAFKAGGPLADAEAPPGEVEGTMMLFRGAYAVLRNPSGHREVTFDDTTEASEAVMTASLLMRMLDRIQQRLQA
ncbi:MAG: TIGR02391 family protein [Actinomycetota bacterium]|nr:TIGR02391 family protein [Actinomycetota bacterium]